MKQYTDEEILGYVQKLRDLLKTLPFLVPKWWLEPILEIGPALFNLWKKILNLKPFANLTFPEPTPFIVFIFLKTVEGIKKRYKTELERKSKEDFWLLRPIYMDIIYGTSFEVLKNKYPEVPEIYLKARAEKNLENLGKRVETVKQKIGTTNLDPGPKGELHAALDFFKDALPFMDFIKDNDKERYQRILEMIEQLGGD